MNDLIIRALLAGFALAAMLGPLGSFVVWRRMAYFGDTIAHSALLGVALSLVTDGVLPMPLSIFMVAGVVSLLLGHFTRDQRFQADTVLGILAHSALAFGILFVAMTHDMRGDLNVYLLGDILGVSWGEIGILGGACGAVLLLVGRFWQPLLMATVEPNIARVEGVNVARMQLLLTLLLAGVIAVSIKLIGVLLITALVIIPAAAARYLSAGPKQMAVFSSVVGMASVLCGLFASISLNSPTGPTIIASSAVLFLICSLLARGKA